MKKKIVFLFSLVIFVSGCLPDYCDNPVSSSGVVVTAPKGVCLEVYKQGYYYPQPTLVAKLREGGSCMVRADYISGYRNTVLVVSVIGGDKRGRYIGSKTHTPYSFLINQYSYRSSHDIRVWNVKRSELK